MGGQESATTRILCVYAAAKDHTKGRTIETLITIVKGGTYLSFR